MVDVVKYCFALFVLVLAAACAGDGNCNAEGAVRERGVCKCPEGTRLIAERGERSVCAAEGAVGATDGGFTGSTKPQNGDAREGSSPVAPKDAQVRDVTLSSDTCDSTGQVRCAMPGTGLRDRCDGDHWVATDPCGGEELCASGSGLKPGACQVPPSACKGNAGKWVCDGAAMLLCDDNGFAEQTAMCDSRLQCETGIAGHRCASCIPGEYRCTGANLERCGSDGLSFEPVLPACDSAALCNAQAGACTAAACLPGNATCEGDVLQSCNSKQTGFDEKDCGDGLCDGVGKQCDVCLPNTKTCKGNSLETCDAQGQAVTASACPSSKPFCASGTCVRCRQTSDCPLAASDCAVAMCNVATGECATTNKPEGSACGTGICDGKGTCGARPTCGDGVVNQGSEQCDDGNRIELDDCLNNCKAAYCGDGLVDSLGSDPRLREDCDISAGADTWKCTGSCKKSTLYNACSSPSGCSDGEVCTAGFCTTNCSVPGAMGTLSGCPAVIREPFVAMCWFSGSCFISGCTRNADCPEGLSCYKGLDSNNPATAICGKTQ